jgi:hypothetical protein
MQKLLATAEILFYIPPKKISQFDTNLIFFRKFVSDKTLTPRFK